jgi:hypothetical protein
MNKTNRKWARRLLVLAGVLIASSVAVVSSSFAGAPHSNPGQPFAAILDDLSTILERLDELEAMIDEQSTDLRGVTQNWDKKLDSTNGETDGCNSDRFTCVLDGLAVRDNETGLVWSRYVSMDRFEWWAGIEHCARQEIAGRYGWHLPRLEQLTSMIDNAATSGTPLPDGHPFVGMQPTNLWTATVAVEAPINSAPRAWVVVTAPPPGAHFGTQPISPADRNPVFCVRGGETYDGQDVQRVIEALAN